MQRQIVVPLDGSRLAERALPHAVALARATDSGLTLLQVVSTLQFVNPLAWGTSPVSVASAVREGILESAGEYLRNVSLQLGSEDKAVQIEVLEGDAAEAIIVFAEQHPEVAVIVMSTRGRSGLTRWVLGSVAEKVLEVSPVPLALIRPQVGSENQTEVDASGIEKRALPPIPSYRTILVPLDGSPLAEEALDYAHTLAAATGAALLLVSVVSPPDPLYSLHSKRTNPAVIGDSLNIVHTLRKEYIAGYLASVARRILDAKTSGIEVRPLVLEGDEAKEIIRAGREGGADLIVMSAHGRGGLSRLWLGHVAMDVVRQADLPVLLVREHVARRLKQPQEPE
jgi:nucleotide-binding universal stress UspA family protein